MAVALISIKPTLMFRRWRKQLAAGGGLPEEAQVRQARKWVMVQAHLIAVIPLAAVFLARGFGAEANPSCRPTRASRYCRYCPVVNDVILRPALHFVNMLFFAAPASFLSAAWVSHADGPSDWLFFHEAGLGRAG